LMAPNLSQIAACFKFDDAERDAKLGGQLSVAFFLLGLPATLIIGLLCDVVQRKQVLVATLLLGQGPCLLTIFVTQFWQLFVLRALTGIAVGGALPLVYSITGDLFPKSSRTHASALVGIVSSLGSMTGQGIAGFMGPSYGWRLPFVVVAAPGLCVAFLVWRFAEEPKRGGAEGSRAVMDYVRPGEKDSAFEHIASKTSSSKSSSSKEVSETERNAPPPSITFGSLLKDFAKKSKSVFARKTNVLVFLQGIPGCVPWSIIGVFMNDYLAVDKGLGVTAATAVLMCFGAGALFGTIGGGFVGQSLYNRQPFYATAFMGAAAVGGIFPWLFLVDYDGYDVGNAGSMRRVYLTATFAGCLCSVTGVNVRAVTVNVNKHHERGTAFAFFNLTDDLGKGFGPVLCAFFIRKMGRQRAFDFGFWCWVPCGVLCVLCGFTVPHDEARVRREARTLGENSGDGTSETAALLGGGDKMV